MKMSIADKGFSLLEVSISVAIFGVIMAATFSILQSTQDMNATEGAVTQTVSSSRLAMDRITKELQESSFLTVDTAFRQDGLRWDNHYEDTTPGNRRCTSPTCAWNTVAGGTNKYPEAYTGSLYGEEPDAVTKVNNEKHGRIWVNEQSPTCPFDDNVLASNAFLDGVKFLSPRNQAKQFVRDTTTGGVDWQSVVFYFPFRSNNATSFELRRYVVYLQDIPVLPFTLNEDRPTLLKLLDFDGDGNIGDGVTANGQADTIQAGYRFKPLSDNRNDLFFVTNTEIVWSKSANFSSRRFEIRINRNTGNVQWTLVGSPFPFIDGIYNFTNRMEIVTTNLLDLDISTHDTNPLIQFAGLGVDSLNEAKIIRLTMIFTAKNKRSLPSETVITTNVFPIN